jgi:hypothetical protein
MTADWQLTNARGAGDGIRTHDVLLGERYREAVGDNGGFEGEQLQLPGGLSSESVALVHVGGEVVAEAGIDDSIGDMFPKVREGIAVRTVLRYEDLLRMRKVFVWYARNNPGDNDVGWARELMKRMLRKGGSEFYSKRIESKANRT